MTAIAFVVLISPALDKVRNADRSTFMLPRFPPPTRASTGRRRLTALSFRALRFGSARSAIARASRSRLLANPSTSAFSVGAGHRNLS